MLRIWTGSTEKWGPFSGPKNRTAPSFYDRGGDQKTDPIFSVSCVNFVSRPWVLDFGFVGPGVMGPGVSGLGVLGIGYWGAVFWGIGPSQNIRSGH